MAKRWSVGGFVSLGILAVTIVASVSGGSELAQASASDCQLGPGGSIRHVVYVQFDNFHLRRDNASVPSDLEQIPALKNFLSSNGTLGSNSHTVLISHTAGGLMASLTGMYPDRNGIGVSNSYGVFRPDGSVEIPNAPAFTYWTDQASNGDPLPNLITDGQKNTPAPWAPYTRAGCDVGAFSIANMELENPRTTAAGDITKVFGNPSPEATFANWSNAGASGSKRRNEAVADFEGIAIHCSQIESGAGGLCSPSHGGRSDLLPDEPTGYTGFNALFGAVSANQVVAVPGAFTPSTQDADGAANGPINNIAPTVNDVYDFSHTVNPCGAPCTGFPAPSPIQDSTGNSGFAGFDPSAAVTLGYTAAMQEAGIPVTFAYIADAHDDHEACNGGNALGPGQACYEQQLQHYNQAFQAFFARLGADGITKDNTLFVFTTEEGDHFAGGPPTNPGCDGVHTACTYTPGTSGPNTVGEITTNLPHLITSETGNTTPFDHHFDDAPTFYVHNDPNGPPGPTNPKVRQLERDIAGLTIANPRTGNQDVVTQHIADPITQEILHMNNTDPLRTPSFTLFGNADYFFQAGSCGSNSSAGCPVVGPRFAWNHGDDNPEIAQTWLGMVGPNVNNLGQTGAVWTDHTDIRPTMLAALGLHDDYSPDGDVITQYLSQSSLPANVQAHLSTVQELTAALKQLNAPFGQFGHDAEVASTTAVATTSNGVYNRFDDQPAACNSQRDSLAGQIQTVLNNAAFNGGQIDDAAANQMIAHAEQLIGNMHSLSQMAVPPDFTVCGSSAEGPPGPPGPAGPPGPQGPPGRDAQVVCTVKGASHKAAKPHGGHHHGNKVKVVCEVNFVNPYGEARLLLKHRGHTAALATAASDRNVVLRAPHGRYRLIVSVTDNGAPKTVIDRHLNL
jgi:hypothetical protein